MLRSSRFSEATALSRVRSHRRRSLSCMFGPVLFNAWELLKQRMADAGLSARLAHSHAAPMPDIRVPLIAASEVGLRQCAATWIYGYSEACRRKARYTGPES